MPDIPTFCRICESQCGLVATVDEGRLAGLRPDREHPVSAGYACEKGLRFADVANRSDRLRSARVDGAEVSVAEATRAAGARLAAIRDRHGPQSIALYLGNAVIHSLGAILGTVGLQRAIGTQKAYSALTLDNASQYRVLHDCFGNAMHTFVADYAGSDCIVLFGTDPLSSQASQAQSHPQGARDLLRRRAELVVVDPRRSMTAKQASLHLAPVPGSDAVLLAWLVREALGAGRRAALSHTELSAFLEALTPFDLARATRDTGLSGGELLGLRDRLLAAERPLVWGGLGILLGPDSTVGWWLTLVLQAILGGLERSGGWRHPPGAVNFAGLWPWLGVPTGSARLASPVGGYAAVLGNLAAATLPEDIRRGGVKALICVGGNPAVSIPESGRVREALASLDLLLCVDAFPNETVQLANIVLPAALWTERSDVNLQYASQRPVPHLQHSPALVAPPPEARDDWDHCLALSEALGRSFFGFPGGTFLVRRLGPEGVARLAVSTLAPFSWRSLVSAPRGVRPADAAAAAPVAPHLAQPAYLAALEKIGPREGMFRLVTSVRPVGEMNSWIGAGPPPPARMHPDDIAGQTVEIEGDGGTLTCPVEADPGVRPGVVVLPYGWGERNPNTVISASALDPFTGQPVSNGSAVQVAWPARPAAADPPR